QIPVSPLLQVLPKPMPMPMPPPAAAGVQVSPVLGVPGQGSRAGAPPPPIMGRPPAPPPPIMGRPPAPLSRPAEPLLAPASGTLVEPAPGLLCAPAWLPDGEPAELAPELLLPPSEVWSGGVSVLLPHAA